LPAGVTFQAPLAAKLYFDCHDALRAERKRRYEV
jgi:hypothetical protein